MHYAYTSAPPLCKEANHNMEHGNNDDVQIQQTTWQQHCSRAKTLKRRSRAKTLEYKGIYLWTNMAVCTFTKAKIGSELTNYITPSPWKHWRWQLIIYFFSIMRQNIFMNIYVYSVQIIIYYHLYDHLWNTGLNET